MLLSCGDVHRARLVAEDLPPDVSLIALLLFSSDGSFAAASGLFDRAPEGRFDLLLHREPPAEGLVQVVGFRERDLDGVLLPDAATLATAPLRPAAPFDLVLPQASWVGSGRWRSDGQPLIVAPVADRPELTAEWVGPCPLACDLVPLAQSRALELPGLTTPAAAVAIPWDATHTAALIVAGGGELFRVTSTVAVPLSEGLPEAIRAGELAPDGEMVLLSESSRLYAGRPESGFRELPTGTRTSTAPGIALAIAPDGSVFSASETGELLFLHGDRQERLYASGERAEKAAVQLLADGTLLAFFTPPGDVLRYQSGRLTSTRPIRGPRALEFVPGIGMILGTTSAPLEQLYPALYKLDESEWVRFAGGEDGSLGILGIDAIFPVEGGFLFGGVRGFLGYYRSGIGVCPQESHTEHHASSAVLLASGRLVVAGRAIDASSSVTVFDPHPVRLHGTHCASSVQKSQTEDLEHE